MKLIVFGVIQGDKHLIDLRFFFKAKPKTSQRLISLFNKLVKYPLL